MDEPPDEAPAAAEHQGAEERRESLEPQPLGHQEVEGDARQQVVQQERREEEVVGVVEVLPRVEEQLEEHRRRIEDAGLDRGEGQRAGEPEAVEHREGAGADALVDEDPPREIQLAVVGREVREGVREEPGEDEGEQEDGGAQQIQEGGDRDQPRGDPVAKPPRSDRHLFDRSICGDGIGPRVDDVHGLGLRVHRDPRRVCKRRVARVGGPAPRLLARAVEQDHGVLERVRREERVAGAVDEVRRGVGSPRRDGPVSLRIALRVDDLEAVVVGVGDVDDAIRGDRDADRGAEVEALLAAPEAVPVLQLGVVPHQAAVPEVGHPDRSVRRHRDAARPVEPSGGCLEVAGQREGRHAAVLGVRHVDGVTARSPHRRDG